MQHAVFNLPNLLIQTTSLRQISNIKIITVKKLCKAKKNKNYYLTRKEEASEGQENTNNFTFFNSHILEKNESVGPFEQTRFLSTVFLCSKFKFENIYRSQ